jgi:hypothetical protein
MLQFDEMRVEDNINSPFTEKIRKSLDSYQYRMSKQSQENSHYLQRPTAMFNTQIRGATAEMQYQIASTMIERPPNVRNFM